MILLAATALAAAPPTFSVERGLHSAPFSLTLSAAPEEAVRYSLDGGLPDLDYSGPIDISGTTLVRAQTVDSAGEASAVATHTYLFVDDVLEQSVLHSRARTDADWRARITSTLQSLPTLSIATEAPLSVYEQAVSFEYIDPDGDLELQIDCGAARVGGHSLGYAKTNLRLYFRRDYGEGRLEADFFDDLDTVGVPSLSEHDSLDLRGGSHDSVFYLATRGQYLRNQWVDETERTMGHLAPHGRHAHLYVNGEYTGLYLLRERFDAAFLAEHRGGSEDDYAAVNGGRTVDGDATIWPAIEAAGTDWESFRRWVDADQYLDYIVLSLYGANTWDWNPYQNWMAAGSPEAVSDWVFHGSDNDICLYYPVDHDVSDRVGPGYSFTNLQLQGHPDFQVAWMDALHRNLTGAGALVGPAASARYSRLASVLDDAVVAEAARWGGGWWDPDLYWTVERDYLTNDWLPLRAEALLEDARGWGWMPLPAPEVDPPAGRVESGTVAELVVPDGIEADLLVRTDGGDPRLPGGEVAPEAVVLDGRWSALLEQGQHVSGRLHRDGTWGPLERVDWTVAASSPVVLNEWNAVQPGEVLDNDGEDSAFGVIEGNGGPWVELLVLEDGVDLRGASLHMADLYGARGEVRFTDAEVLADLRAGTLLTVATELPEDTAYAPEAGDWRFHLQAHPEGPTAVSEGFVVTPHQWHATLRTAAGEVTFGPIGEGQGELFTSGLSGDEVGQLAATPVPGERLDEGAYAVAKQSTYGAPNVWEEGEQDLRALRGEDEPVEEPSEEGRVEVDSGTAQGRGDTGRPAASGASEEAGKGGCATAGSAGGLGWLLAFGLAWRRRTLALSMGLVGCGSPVKTGDRLEPAAGDSAAETEAPAGDSGETGGDCLPEPERCNGEDDDCDGEVDEADADLVDGLPFYVDADADGHGSEETATACALGPGLALVSGDCDDEDATVHPEAEELCDGVDRNCDGSAEDQLGRSAACAVDSCLQLLETAPELADGAYWLALPSGTRTPVWCDLSGGGWTLGFLRNTSAIGNQGSFGAGEQGLDSLGLSPDDASAGGEAALGWMDLNAFDYEELVLTGHAWGARTVRSEPIPRDHLRLSFGEPGYLLYGDPSPYVWCGGENTYTDGGIGQVSPPVGAPAGCRGHGALGSGWDFSTVLDANQGLTLCGSDGYGAMTSSWGAGWVFYGAPGGAQAIWVR